MSKYTQPNLNNCEKEQIHIIGHIQPHGYLLGINPNNLEVLYVSENMLHKLGLPANKSQTLQSFVSDEIVEIINSGIKDGDFSGLSGNRVLLFKEEYQLILNKTGEVLTLEFEPLEKALPESEFHSMIGRAMAKIQNSPNFQDLLKQTAAEIKAITGYDRVMIYQFKKNWDGKVVAEAKREDLESMLDLHFPASDIPVQARELFKINQIRIIADVDAKDEKLIAFHENNNPLDLTHSTLRSSSPIHLEYLRNMGVKASMTISIIYKGQLWGMVTCHHYTKKFVNYSFRNTCKFIGSLFSSAIEFKYDRKEKELLDKYYKNESNLVENVIKGWDILKGLTEFDTKFIDINDSHGAAIYFEGKFFALGAAPTEEQTHAIADRVREISNDSLFISEHLPKIHPDAKSYSDKASGLMMIGLSRKMNDYIMWFKPEQTQTIHWGGNPDKSVNWDAVNQKLNPRKSFEKFALLSQYTSLEWSDGEIAAAIKLREDINNILINKTNEVRALNEELRNAYEYLDTFSYTVSHDLKTPLSSIKGYAEILVKYHKDKIDDDMAKFLNQIIINTDKMKGLIQDVLNYSKIGRIEKAPALVDPEPIINDLIENIKIGNQNKSIEFIVDYLPKLQGDKTMIYQIFNNLMSNAVKYSRENVPVVVKINGVELNGEVTYHINDNGRGFDMKNADRIFELFKRLDDVKSIEGTGLGLAIVKRIITLHKGKIWVESSIGIGTTFSFTLPVV